MFRTILAGCLLLSYAACEAAENSKSGRAAARKSFDWSDWRAIPVLDDGRIKPLDTLADEIVTLVTARSKWTDPETDEKLRAPELLYAWITAPKEWLDKPVIRCEFRPLRKLMNTGQVKVETEGAYVSLRQILDWEKSRETGKPAYWSQDLEDRIDAIDRAAASNKDANMVGDTADDRALNGKVAELFRHMQAFLAARDARNIFVVPGLDPRVLTKQTNPDARLRAWVSLGVLLELDDWANNGDVTVAALMAQDHNELLAKLVPRRIYPLENLPQLAQAQNVKDQIQTDLRAIKSSLDASRKAYDKAEASEFASSMQTFVRNIRRLADAIEAGRLKMTPPELGDFNFGTLDKQVWASYESLELSTRQMTFSAYPALGSTQMKMIALELIYNRLQPFRTAWIFFLLALIVVVVSMMVKAQRTVYLAGLAVTLGAVAYSTWGFALRVAVSGRPPVTNMYETVVWVSYVVAVLGLWFCLIPLTWPGLSWAWRLSGLPLRLQRNAEGRISGIELDRLAPGEQDRLFAGMHLAVQSMASFWRIAGFVGIVWFLTQSDTTFAISTLLPPERSSMGTWLVGITTVMISAWYFPRAVLALCGALVTVVPEGRRGSSKLWQQTLARRYFLLGSLPVACFGMMLAHFVGMSSPDILNPRIGSLPAVLRNNYWLTIHVLTIVSSYGAGALAWGLGNLAMLYYLVGKYRPEGAPSKVAEAGTADSTAATGEVAEQPEQGPIFDLDKAHNKPKQDGLGSRLKTVGKALRPVAIRKTFKAGFQGFGTADEHLETARVRPPQEVSTLANYGYKTMQVAVLLLAAGTILGGLWADVSWGRFWDWDPKEVWALISLLVYVAVLHGRFAGWVGTFGTNASCVLCFNAILMSWYGVNFVLPMVHGWLNGTGKVTEVGLHSYGTGAGGLVYVIGAVVLNVLFVLAALARYVAETTESSHSQSASVGEKETSTDVEAVS